MNLQQKMPTTADEFLRWNEGREGKREFVRGKVVELMINVTENHYRLATRLVVQLAAQLNDDEFIVGSADFGVLTAGGVRFPDVMVHKPGGGHDLATKTPLLIAEILSPSFMADDVGGKAQEYLKLDSLRHYIILSQDEPRVWLWSRREDGRWTGPDMAAGTAVPVSLSGLGASLDLDRLYGGIGRPPAGS
jgi:Uma2 family endonuclease